MQGLFKDNLVLKNSEISGASLGFILYSTNQSKHCCQTIIYHLTRGTSHNQVVQSLEGTEPSKFNRDYRGLITPEKYNDYNRWVSQQIQVVLLNTRV